MGRSYHVDPHARLAWRTRHGILLFPNSNPRTVGVQVLFRVEGFGAGCWVFGVRYSDAQGFRRSGGHGFGCRYGGGGVDVDDGFEFEWVGRVGAEEAVFAGGRLAAIF